MIARPLLACGDNKDRAAAALLRNLTPTTNRPRRSMFSPQSSRPSTRSSKDAPKKQNSESWSVTAFAKAQLGGLALRRRGRQESRAGSSKAPSLMSMKEEDEAPNNAPQDVRMSLRDKPLPSIPGKSFSPTENDPDLGGLPAHLAAPREMGFSFRPGDDASILSPRVAEDEGKRFPTGQALRQASSNEAAWRSRTVLSSPAEGSENRPKVPPTAKAKPKTTRKKSYIPESFRDYRSPSRGDSSDSSVITAVRDNSARNSLDGGEKDKQAATPKLEGDVGDAVGDTVGDAVAAGAKALADSSNRTSEPSGGALVTRDEVDRS
jgi:hypothetical protein